MRVIPKLKISKRIKSWIEACLIVDRKYQRGLEKCEICEKDAGIAQLRRSSRWWEIVVVVVVLHGMIRWMHIHCNFML